MFLNIQFETKFMKNELLYLKIFLSYATLKKYIHITKILNSRFNFQNFCL